MSKHTPGPWSVKKIHNSVTYVGAPTYPGHPYHKRATHIEVMSDEDYPTKEADARLIAAAPELLEALKDCLAYNDAAAGEFSWAAKARTAIAKAEGQ